MSKPRILIIANNNIGSGQSGGDTIFLNIIKNWQTHSQFTVLGAQETKNLLNRYKLKSVNFIKTDNISRRKIFWHQIHRLILGTKTLYKHKEILKEFDYVYSASDFYPDFFPSFLTKLLNPSIKWIASFYLFAPNPFNKNSPYNLTHQSIKGILYYLMQKPTNLIANLFADYIFVTSHPDIKHFSNKKVIVVRGGVDLKKFKPIPLTQRKYAAVFMGRFHPQKGILELVDIWKIVCCSIPQAKLAIIGDGLLYNQVKNKINQLGLSNNIVLKGFLIGKPKENIFKQSKVVLHPAIYDSGGMSAAEAMSFGLPGVCFDLQSLKKYYPQGMIKTPCFNQQKFAKNIINLLTNDKIYQKTSKQATKLMTTSWLWSNQLEKIYQQIK